MVAGYDAAACQRGIDAMRAAGSWWVPTHVTREEEARATDPSFLDDPRLAYLDPLSRWAYKDDLAATHYFRMARIMGTGGAARAIIAALADKGFTMVVAGRDPAKARALLDELAPKGEHHAIHLSHFADPTDFAFDDREGCLDLVINASSLGMQGQPPLLFDWSHAPPGSIAYDIVTAPLDTPFLQGARAKGLRTIDGLSMLIGQAATAFEHFFGAPPPREHDAELRAILTQ